MQNKREGGKEEKVKEGKRKNKKKIAAKWKNDNVKSGKKQNKITKN